MNAFVFWLERPFNPRRVPRKGRSRGRTVTIRYSGSFGRSAFKILIVLALLMTMSNVIGDATSQDLPRAAAAAGDQGRTPE